MWPSAPTMGAILSKFCFSCCTGLSSSKSRSSASKSSSRKLSHRPSLIIQRSQVFREAEAGSEYSRVLERELEIWGSGVVGGDGRSPLGEDGTAFINRPHSASNESVETNGDYPRKVSRPPTLPGLSGLIPQPFLLLGVSTAAQRKPPALHTRPHQKVALEFTQRRFAFQGNFAAGP